MDFMAIGALSVGVGEEGAARAKAGSVPPAAVAALPARPPALHLRRMRSLRRSLRGPLGLLPLLALACGPSKPDARGADTANLAAQAAAATSAPAAPAPDLTRVDTAFAPALDVSLGRMRRLPSGLYVRDVKRGAGREATAGRGVVVHYLGRLPDGTPFDDSRKRGRPAKFILGQGVVIQGWDEGIAGMKAGGRRQLVVPPALGYGLAGKPGAVPSASTLVFDVELVEVR